MEDIKAGDIVLLRSGGPLMVVDQYDSFRLHPVICVWFTPEGGMKSGMFKKEVLWRVGSNGDPPNE